MRGRAQQTTLKNLIVMVVSHEDQPPSKPKNTKERAAQGQFHPSCVF